MMCNFEGYEKYWGNIDDRNIEFIKYKQRLRKYMISLRFGLGTLESLIYKCTEDYADNRPELEYIISELNMLK